MRKICILGEDERSKNLKRMYENEGFALEDYKKADIIISPIPFSRDNVFITYENINIDDLIASLKNNPKSILITGSINSICRERLDNNNVRYIDIMESEKFVDKNALATAEGTIKSIMENTKFTLSGANIAIVGLGRIAKYIVKFLRAFESNVTVYARRDEALLEARNTYGVNSENISNMKVTLKNNSVVINTVPSVILEREILETLDVSTVIIDIASNPGGVDKDEAKNLGINTLWELGIPAKYSPISAARYIKEEIDNIIVEN